MTTSREKKTHTVKQVDELTAQAGREGFITGMVESHRVFSDVMTDLKASIENMQAIYDVGNHFGKSTPKIQELQFVWDALTHFDNMFQDKYDTSIDNAKDPEYYDEVAAELDIF